MLDHCKSMPQYSVCAMLGPMTAVHSGRVVHACLVVLRPRRAADTSTNRRHGFLCHRTASVEQVADTAEAAAVNQYSLLPTKNISVPVCPWTPGYRLMTVFLCALVLPWGGSVAEWLPCWTQAQKGPGSNRSCDAVG